jgi:beta-galactosidase
LPTTEKKYINSRFKHIIHGADYNPDQWINYPEVLKEDLRLMKLAGFNSATVGIFSWDKLEPEDGKYNFEFLDKIMDDIYKNGGSIILATPSAARPVWMSVKYPEVDRTTESFQHRLHGDRENHCYTSPVFRKKIIEIDRLLAKRYKDHPALFAWHVSNEYNGSCYCNMCIMEFRNWLKRKYGSLDNLNEQWWTAFWAHTYTDWDQINPPSKISDTAVNGLSLDWERFCSYQTTECMMDEVRVLREITPNVPITTNYYTTSLDLREMVKGLDFTCWVTYRCCCTTNQY